MTALARSRPILQNTGMGSPIRRRRFLTLAASAAALPLIPRLSRSENVHARVVPSSGETVPAIGLGTAYTFDVPPTGVLLESRARVLRGFFELGGRMVDSAPMYGRAETLIGKALAGMSAAPPLFSATKVWIPGAAPGRLQMERSMKLWGLDRFDLVYVHNLVDWQAHLPWLQDWKADGKIRYLGVTTSHGRRHDEIERIMAREPLDFVQFTYNVEQRVAEERLIPLARDRGMAVVINRPFERGGLFDRVEGRPLPGFAGEIDCANWAQFFLKFIISHPDVTCAIPATTNIDHLRQNMGALAGALPDAGMRRRMVTWFEQVAS